MNEANKAVDLLLEKAAKAEKSEDAMRFSQAATNAANALFALETFKHQQVQNERDRR